MKNTFIKVTPNKWWALLNKILRRPTYWTVAYDATGYSGYDWFDDDYETKYDAYNSANKYFHFVCAEDMYDSGAREYQSSMPIVLAEYFFFRDERRYISAIAETLQFDGYRDEIQVPR